jgi:hypothetical protein
VDIQPELAELFPQQLGFFGNPEVEVEVMELPYVFRTSVSTIPRRVPYPGLKERVRPQPEITHFDSAVLNVGLVWASGCWNPHRSIPPHLLQRLRGLTGVRFYSLQQGPSAFGYGHVAAACCAAEPSNPAYGCGSGCDASPRPDDQCGFHAGSSRRSAWASGLDSPALSC